MVDVCELALVGAVNTRIHMDAFQPKIWTPVPHFVWGYKEASIMLFRKTIQCPASVSILWDVAKRRHSTQRALLLVFAVTTRLPAW